MDVPDNSDNDKLWTEQLLQFFSKRDEEGNPTGEVVIALRSAIDTVASIELLACAVRAYYRAQFDGAIPDQNLSHHLDQICGHAGDLAEYLEDPGDHG